MEKISITKLEKEFNSNNDFNIESIIDLNNTKDNGKTVRKLLSNFSNYDDLVNESDKRINKDTEYVESLSSVEKLSRELELKYLDKDNKVIDESNIVGKIAIREKKLKQLEEEIALIKEDGNEPSETKINNKKSIEAELAKLNNQKEVFTNNLKFQQKEIDDVKTRIEKEKEIKESNAKKAREAYYKIIKLTEFCTIEIKNAKKELSKANKAYKTFLNKNSEDFTKLSIEEQKAYSKKQFELQTNIINAGEVLLNNRNKYLKILATISNFASEEYPGLKTNIDSIITKLDSESKKAMEDIDVVDVIEIEEPVKEEAKDEPTDTPKEENKNDDYISSLTDEEKETLFKLLDYDEETKELTVKPVKSIGEVAEFIAGKPIICKFNKKDLNGEGKTADEIIEEYFGEDYEDYEKEKEKSDKIKEYYKKEKEKTDETVEETEEPEVEKTDEETETEKEEVEEKTEEKVDEEIKEAKTNLGRAFAKEEGKKITDIPPRKFFKTTELPKINEMPERPDSMSISEYMSNWASRIDKGEAEPAFIDESRIDEKHSWMNADQARATGNLANAPKIDKEPSFVEKVADKANETKEKTESTIDKLIAKIKELNNSSTIGEKTAEPEQEEKVDNELKEEKTPYNFAQEMKKLHEIREERKAEAPKTEEPTSEYVEFNKVDEPVVDVVPTGNESSYVEFNKPDDEFIDSSEDKVSFVDDNTEYVMEEPKPNFITSAVTKVIVNVKDASTKLVNEAKDRAAKFFLNAETYQLYLSEKNANKEAAVKVKE